MEKIELVMDEAEPKKHSIRYNCTFPGDVPITSVYIKRQFLPNPFPTQVKIIVEWVKD